MNKASMLAEPEASGRYRLLPTQVTSGLLGTVAGGVPEMTKSTFLFNFQLQPDAFPCDVFLP